MRSLPGFSKLGDVLWREVVRSVFYQGRVKAGENGGWGEAYFDKVKAMESKVRIYS